MNALTYPFDAGTILRKSKSLRRALLDDGRPRFQKRIAVLGGSTTSDIVRILELFLLDAGIEPVFYECDYGQYEQEALFPGEEFLSFAPDVIFLHTSNRNIRNLPEMSDSPAAIEEKLQQEFARFRAIWNSLREKFHCPIIQNNFELPLYRLLGNKDCSDPHGERNFIARLNQELYQYAAATEHFYVHDLLYVSADYGLREWSNPYYWNMYKYCLCVDAIPYLSYSVASMIKSLFGRNKKVLALDLDNTLWGGVIGDDGPGGIEIGQENGVAQSYYEFQEYIKKLSGIGVLLTVCSKNEPENALEGLNHPDGVLRPDDFQIIKANWENKDRNLVSTAEELQLLPESIVFADDNPAERAIVGSQLPDVAVPAMDGVETYIRTLDRSAFFEVTSLQEDDLKRNEMYRENMQRQAAQAAFADYDDYLRSLEMRAVIEDFTPIHIARITQLTNKSNQFNLTTRRYTPAEMEEVWKSPQYIRLYGKLVDRFGDNGVVSVVIGEKRDRDLHIVLWLMSCRVLKRDMEFAMLDALMEACAEAGLQTVYGYYYPTAKNKMVRDLYATFGFTKTQEDADGNTVWALPVAPYKKKNRCITVE